MTVTEDKTEWFNGLVLKRGGHSGESHGFCAMEAAAYLAGEPWSDHPECVSPVISAFARSWNDGLPNDDRTRLIKPLIPAMLGTAKGADCDERLAWMACDWLVRVQAPAWLRAAGLDDHAAALAAADEVTADTAQAIRPAVVAATVAATVAAGAAATVAVRDAVRAAATVAARDAVGVAVRVAVRDAVRVAAQAAVGAAVGAAARDALEPTVRELQPAAVDLLGRMCDTAHQW